MFQRKGGLCSVLEMLTIKLKRVHEECYMGRVWRHLCEHTPLRPCHIFHALASSLSPLCANCIFAAQHTHDFGIFAFALNLEYLEAQFYGLMVDVSTRPLPSLLSLRCDS